MFDHEKLKVYFRDEIVDFNDAKISICSTAFLYGLAVFTGIRSHYNDKQKKSYIFRAEEHYKRFRYQCQLFRYKNFLENYDCQRFVSSIRSLLQVNNLNEDVYIRASNFTDENKVTPKFIDYKDSFSIFLYPIGNYVPTTGMRCKVSSWTRVEDNAIPARAKVNGLYVNTAFAKTEALMHGYDEALFLDSNGHVVEGSAENIFIVQDGVLITPPKSDNILEGITRQTVFDFAKDLGIQIIERSIDRSELYKSDEIFLTGTGAQISPVIEVDKYSISDGKIGKISGKLQQMYFSAVRGESPEYMKWLTEV
jgi:branched-chain amino acid aminotransferase